MVSTLSSWAQIAQPTPLATPEQPVALPTATPPTAAISGTVVDSTGAVVAGAHVRFSTEPEVPTQIQEVITDTAGFYFFNSVPPGPFQLSITSKDFAPQTVSGTLSPGESHKVPTTTLTVAAETTEVQVMPTAEVAEMQIKEQEQQRVLAVIPNFYVSYVPDAAPLNSRQKFELAWRSTVDPINFAITGLAAGVQQAANQYPGYGQGAEGYGKRFGANFADNAVGTFVGGYFLPVLFRQDPRYFYKGTGTNRSRLFYALSRTVICKGDNGRWEFNYSNVLGAFIAGSISNAYYPEADRGAGLTVESALVGLGGNAVVNVFQEFVIRKFTPHVNKNQNQNKP